MTDTKKAPTGQGQGQKINPDILYPSNHALSTAAQILLLIEQAPDHADLLRQACWNRLEAVLQGYYGRAGR